MNTAQPRNTLDLVPAARLSGLEPYTPGLRDDRIDLALDANEGPRAHEILIRALERIGPEQLRRYPQADALEGLLAGRLGIEAERVVVTAGGDDAIDRICRVALEPGRSLVVHAPTFEMIERNARLAGGTVRSCHWFGGAFPVGAMCEAIDASTGLVALVSPNNPTGGVVSCDDMVRVVRAAERVGALVLVDLAYVEFARQDPTPVLLAQGNVVIVRTFSKVYGLAGLRVGYTVASRQVSRWLRTVGGPFPVSTLGLGVAGAALERRLDQAYIEQVGRERDVASSLIRWRGGEALESEGNFVLARLGDAHLVRDQLSQRGIGVRAFANRGVLDGWLRITMPGHAGDFARLQRAIGELELAEDE